MKDKHVTGKIEEIRKILTELRARKISSPEKICTLEENCELLAAIGNYNFYIVEPDYCKLRTNGKNDIYFPYHAVLRNIFVLSKLMNSSTNGLKDMTPITKESHDSNENVGYFRLERIYAVPWNVKSLLDNEIAKRKKTIQKEESSRANEPARIAKYYRCFGARLIET